MKLKIPPPLVALIFATLMWLVGNLVPAATMEIPGRSLLSIFFLGLGFAIASSAFMTFRKVGTTIDPLKPADASRLVRNGVFRFSRNPMYLGLTLFLIAWLIWLGNVANVVTLVLFVAYLTHFQIKPEEEALTKLFGDDYETYRANVRRWI